MKFHLTILAFTLLPTMAFAGLDQEATSAFFRDSGVNQAFANLHSQGCETEGDPIVTYIGGHTGGPNVFRHVMMVSQNFVCRDLVDYFRGAAVSAKVTKIHWDTSMADGFSFSVEVADFARSAPPVSGGGCFW